jgi:ubiquitin carboxyl-terminal hydrolase 25/28
MVSGDDTKPDRNMSDWPVGLQNIGNTCYLNSLLQFYFSAASLLIHRHRHRH